MHLPDSMLQGAVCPITASLATVGVAAAAIAAHRSPERPSAARFGAVTAFVFAAQMVNFPVLHGTSGHILGGVLAAALLGVPAGVVSIALVVTVQALVFADGGLGVLGTNLLNMAVIGAGAGGLIRNGLLLGARRAWAPLATALAAWASVVLASLAVAIQLALAGTAPFTEALTNLVSIHALIGMGEGLVTAGLVVLLAARRPAAAQHAVAVPLAVATLVALMLAPYASALPDGLESVAQQLQFVQHDGVATHALLADYAIPGWGEASFGTSLAGLIGALISFAAAWLLARPVALAVARR